MAVSTKMTLKEFTVEDAALEWFGTLGYAVGHGPDFRRANRRRSGIRFLRWYWWVACARPSSGCILLFAKPAPPTFSDDGGGHHYSNCQC